MNILFMKTYLAVGAGLPSLNFLKDYISDEATSAATIVLFVLSVIYLCKQQIGKFIMFLGFAAFVLFVLSSPESVISGIKALWQQVI